MHRSIIYMELPLELKVLYRHWAFHTVQRNKSLFVITESGEKVLGEIKWFILERINIWRQKVLGKSPPYTADPILGRYRFCNIFREFDRQTIEFHRLLDPLRYDFPLWLLNMFYCRIVARPETVNKVGLLSFDDKQNQAVYRSLIEMSSPRFGNAYVFPISVIQKSPWPTRELFMTHYLPKAIPAAAREIKTWDRRSVYDGLGAVLAIFSYNLSFLWTEVLIDTAYQFPEYLDLFGRFPVGPGALPTFKKINAAKEPSLLATELCSVDVDTGITFGGNPLRLSAENWEGIGCEFRKYTNLGTGKGRKRIYAPSPNT